MSAPPLALPAATPRIVKLGTRLPPISCFTVTFGARLPMSLAFWIRFVVIAWDVSAVIEIGTFCRFSCFFWAVTTIS